MTQPKIIADFDSQLATAIAVAGTSFTLSSATDDDGNALPAGLYYFTVDNGSSAKEYLAGTLSGTSVTGVVSVSRQGVETSGAARAHRVGASVLLTDFATYKKYIDDVALAGTVDSSTTAKGVLETATQAEFDAGTATGGTGANLAVTPAVVRARLVNSYAADAGSTDDYAITITPAITAYTLGQEFTFKANTANTGAATLNVSGLGAKAIIRSDGSSALSTGDIIAGEIVQVIYDGTSMRMFKTSLTSNVQVFTANGTWNNPGGTSQVDVILLGGGGGGGGALVGASNGGGGGGGGAYSTQVFQSSLLTNTVAITIGAAGTVGAGVAGGAGGNTTFGAYLKAGGGGGGGATGGGGAGGIGTQNGGAGGAGGTYNATGGAVGSSSTGLGAPGGGGGGGGQGNPGAAGGSNLMYTAATGGAGGSAGPTNGQPGVTGVAAITNEAIAGGGGGGGGGSVGASFSGGAGGPGVIYGAGGGGGGGSNAGGTTTTGGVGAVGIAVIITH